jgi:hypothetical protein
MGISRSATVVAAYLMFRHGLTPDEAITWLRICRPIINPNSGFREQLQDYYSVLQMDHGQPFGWEQLSICKSYHCDTDYEETKRRKRKCTESIRQQWKDEGIEWIKCEVIGWDDTMEQLVQQQFSHAHRQGPA